MKRTRWFGGLAVVGLGSLLAFQNCAKFESGSSGSADNSSTAVHSDPVIMRLSSDEIPNVDITFQVYDESLSGSASYLWSFSLDGASTGCVAKSATNATVFTINCTQAGNLQVNAQVRDMGATRALNYSTVLKAPSTTGGEIPLQITFEIPSGTGSGKWNTATNKVEVFIGQTLKLKNMDSRNHQLHTGGKPCPHGNAIVTGATVDCVISKAYDPATNGAVYDHGDGPTAPFVVVAYDGAALYSTKCSMCHGSLADSGHKNAKVSQILNARVSVAEMKANAAVVALTRRQIEAISYALGGR